MMPLRLLVFIAALAIVLVFIGFNFDNRCDISLLFVTFRSVPIVLTMLSAYILGLLSALVLAVRRKVRKPSVGGSAAVPQAGSARQANSTKRAKSSRQRI
jgi:uncharacterized integral membrane protein